MLGGRFVGMAPPFRMTRRHPYAELIFVPYSRTSHLRQYLGCRGSQLARAVMLNRRRTDVVNSEIESGNGN